MSNFRKTRDKGHTGTDGASRIMAPVGRWGKEGSSLLAFGERRKSRHLLLFNPAAEAAVSLLGGVVDIEETFDPARSLTAACGLQSPQQTALRTTRSTDVSWVHWRLRREAAGREAAEAVRKSDSKSADFRSGSGECPQSCPTGAESEGSVGWRLWSAAEQLTAVRHHFGCSSELQVFRLSWVMRIAIKCPYLTW